MLFICVQHFKTTYLFQQLSVALQNGNKRGLV